MERWLSGDDGCDELSEAPVGDGDSRGVVNRVEGVERIFNFDGVLKGLGQVGWNGRVEDCADDVLSACVESA